MSGRGGAEFSKVNSGNKTDFLEQQRLARERRVLSAKEEASALRLQSVARGFLARRRFLKDVQDRFDRVLQYSDKTDEYSPNLVPAIEAYTSARTYVIFFFKNAQRATCRFECLCKYINLSLGSDSMKLNYLALIIKKGISVEWMEHIKTILVKSLQFLPHLHPENPAGMRTVNTLLTMLISFTSTDKWKIINGPSANVLRPAMNQLCKNIIVYLFKRDALQSLQAVLFKGLVKPRPVFKKPTLSALSTLVLRFYSALSFDGNSTREILLHFISIPAVFSYMKSICDDMYTQFITHRIFNKLLVYLCNDDQLQAIAVTLEGNKTICLLGNLLQLGIDEMATILDNLHSFTSVITKLLTVCEEFMMNKKSSKSHWHPILGWSGQQFDYNDAVPQLMKQLQLMWDNKTLKLLFNDLMEFADHQVEVTTNEENKKKSGLSALKKKVMKPTQLKLDSGLVLNTCSACYMYQTVTAVLSQLNTEVLSGLAFNTTLLLNMWKLIRSISGTSNNPKPFIDSLKSSTSHTAQLASILNLFCDTASMLFMVLDDYELYECQKPFSIEDCIQISDLLNQFIFKIIWQDVIGWKSAESDPLFNSALALLKILYERDCRRQYAPPNHWLVKDIRPSQFISSIDKGNKTAQFLLQKIPHIIPHKERVILFRKWVSNEKETLGLNDQSHSLPHNMTFITVYRSRVLEDGYRQLSELPALSLKGLIRVKFVNEQGLDEAGIDQDGVFKEYLEETIKRVFDPSLNLFKVTDEQKLYPSSTSSIQEHHLKLFEFVGRMLAKAVYEGIVVDVPFAPFFLTQILDNKKGVMYSYLDELPSLDPELYKNLNYVKHYDGDVSDLDLNFSFDEDFMGKLKNFELKPGGSAIHVTNENKISYVHYMARFKMHTQIMEQTAAFITGFRSIINYEWLKIFSTPEIQKLISGDTIQIDLSDLRRHTQYYGGFHNNHKVVSWLWEVLDKDFDEKERGLFLKFVTSCSKPPLLGFSQLEPPFSIRCVEVSDEQDTGDTVGSVLKGFFSIRNRRKEPAGRLPTSSTCFNLLKLPNYSKKSLLREKLRYSIHSNTGFELS